MICPTCSQNFRGNFCPHCGAQVNQEVVRRNGKAIYQKLNFWLIIFAGLVVSIAFTYFLSSESNNLAVDGGVAVSEGKTLGNRLNPAKMGDAITVPQDDFLYGTGTLQVSLLEVTRGSAALKLVKEENQFNSEPELGNEYLLAKFYIKCTENLTEKDKPIEVNSARFSYANNEYTINEDLVLFAYKEPQLQAELYTDSTTEGYTIFEIPKNDNGYVVFEDTWFYVGREAKTDEAK